MSWISMTCCVYAPKVKSRARVVQFWQRNFRKFQGKRKERTKYMSPAFDGKEKNSGLCEYCKARGSATWVYRLVNWSMYGKVKLHQKWIVLLYGSSFPQPLTSLLCLCHPITHLLFSYFYGAQRIFASPARVSIACLFCNHIQFELFCY